MRACETCGVPLFDGRRRYCSPTCRASHEARLFPRRARSCPECGGPCKTAFCSADCRHGFAARRQRRALELLDLALAGGDVAAALEAWAREDAAAGRAPPQRLRAGRKPNPRDVLAAYNSGVPVKVICADFGLRPGSLYRIVRPTRDRTGRMGGAKGTKQHANHRKAHAEA